MYTDICFCFTHIRADQDNVAQEVRLLKSQKRNTFNLISCSLHFFPPLAHNALDSTVL